MSQDLLIRCQLWEHEWRGMASTSGPSDMWCARCGMRSTKDPYLLRIAAEHAKSSAVRPDVTTRLAEAADRAAKAEARADKAEAAVFELQDDVKDEWQRAQEISIELEAAEAQVAALIAQLDEARGVLRHIEWAGRLNARGEETCPYCTEAEDYGHAYECPLAAVLAPETGKETCSHPHVENNNEGWKCLHCGAKNPLEFLKTKKETQDD